MKFFLSLQAASREEDSKRHTAEENGQVETVHPNQDSVLIYSFLSVVVDMDLGHKPFRQLIVDDDTWEARECDKVREHSQQRRPPAGLEDIPA